jgi:hypothetical protein
VVLGLNLYLQAKVDSVGRVQTETFKNVLFHLSSDHSTLKAIALTCRSARELAQSILYRHLQFTGWKFNFAPTKKQRGMLRLVLERVVGLRSSIVRPYIETVTLVDWTTGHPEPTIWEIGEKLFELLRELPNLTHAEARGVLFKSDHFMKLAGGPSTRSITLHECTFPFDNTVPYKLQSVTLREPPGLKGTAVSSFAYAATGILLPEHLEKLTLEAPEALSQLLPQLVELAPFDRLTSLRLVVRPSNALIRFLLRCPALQHAEIIAHTTSDLACLRDLPSSAVPHLESLISTVDVALMILPGRQVRSLTLVTDDADRNAAFAVGVAKTTLCSLDAQTRAGITDLSICMESAVGAGVDATALLSFHNILPGLKTVNFLGACI